MSDRDMNTGSARDTTGRDLVLFDLDGTLADISHRRPLIEKPNKVDADWRAFYAACTNDTLNAAVYRSWTALMNDGLSMWIVSGRSKEVGGQTKRWLADNGIFPHRLLMREDGDHQPDTKLKKAWLVDGTIPKDRVLCVFDDRDSVVAMWRGEGLTCFQVAPGDF